MAKKQAAKKQADPINEIIGQVEQSAKFASAEVRGHWTAMFECGAINNLLDECYQRWSDRELIENATFTVIRAAETWGYALAYARDRVDDAF